MDLAAECSNKYYHGSLPFEEADAEYRIPRLIRRLKANGAHLRVQKPSPWTPAIHWRTAAVC